MCSSDLGFVQDPRRERLRVQEHVALFVVGVSNACIAATDVAVVRGAYAALTTQLAVPLLWSQSVDCFCFVYANDDFGDFFVFVEKRVMCHYYQLTVPVPAVKVRTVLPPLVALV